LVAPCDHLSRAARKTGYGSHDILERAQIFDELEAALEGVDLVIGTTAKRRDGRHDYHHPRELGKIILGKAAVLQNVGLVFGREDRGLSNLELDLCDLISTIPLGADYPSLNLSHAVMIYAYEISNISLNLAVAPAGSERELKELKKSARELLQWLEINKKNSLRRRIMDRLALVKSTDVHLLLSLWKSIDYRRKLPGQDEPIPRSKGSQPRPRQPA